MAYQETTQIANTDKERIDPATLQSVETLSYILQLLKPLSIVTSGTGRLSIDAAVTGSLSTAGTVSTVTTVGSVTNAASIGGLSGFEMQYNIAHSAFASSIQKNITF